MPLSLLLADNNVKKWKCFHPHYLESGPICAQMSRIKAVKEREKKTKARCKKRDASLNLLWVGETF